MSLRADLRASTADDHARLDVAFGRFDLGDRQAYRRFLTAHARALAPVEAAILASGDTAGWRPRFPLVTADLAMLDAPVPPAMALDMPATARSWGMRYVVEGSRLGGAMLARQVGAGLPAAYLGAQHGRGEWRHFLEVLEARGEAGGAEWRADAVAGARDAFALFARSAAMEDGNDG